MSPWTKRDVNRLRAQMLSQNRTTEEIAEEIRVLCGCSRLAAFRMALGLSQPDVIDRYDAEAPSSIMDQPQLSRLESWPAAGSREPLAAQIITLASIYGTTPLRLLTPAALDQMNETEREVVVRCNASFTGTPLKQAITQTQTPKIRLEQSAQRAEPDCLQRKVQMAARRSLRFATTVEGSNVGPETLDQLRAEIAALASAYPQQPLPTLIGDLVDLQEIAFRLLEGRQRPSETAELHLLAGVVCGMLAKASHDLGDPHAGMTQARTAFVCADNAGHDGLRAWIRSLQSMIAYWAGWPHEAVRYSQSGAQYTPHSRGTCSVWLPAQEARAWAVLGDHHRAIDALERADAARDRTEPDDLDAIGGIMTFPRPRQLYYAADARVWIPGDEQRAEAAADEAIAAYENAPPQERSYSDEAGARADQALARVNLGDVEGAADALRQVLDLPTEQRIGGVIASAMRVHVALRSSDYRGVSAATHLQQQIEMYGRTSASAALPRGR